jgi:hypothetical protein
MAEYKAERAFKGIWIPKEIWLSEKMTLQEKVFLAEIDSLDRGQGCYASNKYFAKFFGLSKKRVSFVINSLCEKGLVKSLVDIKAGNKRRLRPSTCFKGYPIPGNGDTPIPESGDQYNKDKPFERIVDKKDFSRKVLSSADAQERGYQLLLQYGVHTKTAKAIIYEQHTPLESIEETIKNGLAKQEYESGFVLQSGYIVEALNRARDEGKIVGPTNKSKMLHAKIEHKGFLKSTSHHQLSPSEFERRRKKISNDFKTAWVSAAVA